MSEIRLAPAEFQFAELIWEHAPFTTGELVKLCAAHFGWKRSTTYTVLKRLSQKGLFQAENGQVTVLISKAEYEGIQSEQFVEENFHGSLPAFLVSFGSRKKLCASDIDALQRVIDRMRE